MRRYDDPYYGGYPMGPEWGRPHPMDPNWADGEYHGQRMGWDHRQAGYGYHRQMRERDLQGYGGFDGIYDEGPGRYNAEGQFEHPYFRGEMRHPRSRPEPRGYDRGMRHVEDGGVRGDARFLRQYNANSPQLRGGGYDRGFGWAPAGPREGQLTNPGLRGRPTDERGYAGYNRGGFAPDAGPRGASPRQR
jgi:hypothetical protein